MQTHRPDPAAADPGDDPAPDLDPVGAAAGDPVAADEVSELEAVDPPTKAHVRIPHAPGLDGLRGLAVAAVLVFHAGPASWLPGGFLGVSLFFTLSGYLITSLVLAEIRRDRAVDLWGFWARRMRRLVPALLVTILGVWAVSEFADLRRGIRADLIGGLTYSANWAQVISGNSYGDLFRAPSPLVHLWSLAIEEQFYVVLPLVAWVVARRAPWLARQRLAVGAAVVTVAGAIATFVTTDPTLGYYSTLDRAPEIAIGVLLACVTQVTTERAPRWMSAVGIAALVAAAAACRTVAVTDGLVTSGGLLVFALLSAAMVRVAARPGPLSSLLSFAPLRWLGLISYGLYLYHWPVVVLLDPRRTVFGWQVDLAPVPLFALRVAVSLALSVLSYWVLEKPMRGGRPDLPSGRVVAIGTGVLAAALVLVLVTVPADPTDAPRRAPSAAVVDPSASRTTVPGAPAGPPVVAILGDSVPAWMIRDGGWSLDPDQIALIDGTLPACDGAEGTPEAKSVTGALVPIPEGCTGWKTQYPEFFGETTDVAILMVGGHAALDREIEGAFRGPCDPVAEAWYRDDIDARLRYLQFHSRQVVVVLPAWADDLSAWIYPEDHRERMDCVRATLTEAAQEANVPTLDFGGYVCPDGPTACKPLRTRDGMHLDPQNAPDALRWLLTEAIELRRAPGS